MNITTLKPGMSHVNLTVQVLQLAEFRRTVTSGGTEHEILELSVGDTSGTIKLVLWDEKIIPDLEEGDTLKIENGFVTSFKGQWRINVGRYGTISKT